MRATHLLLAALAVPSLVSAGTFSDQARVVRVNEAYSERNEPVERCYTENVGAAPQDSSPSVGGAVLGAIAGGIIGNQVGKGNGNKAATAVGAVAGGFAGEHIGRNTREPGYGSRQVQRCYMEDRPIRVSSGFDVTYEYGGQLFQTRLPYHPGGSLNVNVTVSPQGGASRY